MLLSKRNFLKGGLIAASAGLAPRLPAAVTDQPAPRLLPRALAALNAHRNRISRHDRIGIVDFAIASREPRLMIVNLESGRFHSLLVAHGIGSDPGHSGWLQRFSNVPGSEASSNGSYATAGTYSGKHGHSRRLIGLDPTNDQAWDRAIVIHAADYVGPGVARSQGKIGRSQGCFAVSPADLAEAMDALGEGRLLFAAR